MNIHVEPKIFASKNHLKRYMPEKSRQMMYQNAINTIKAKKMNPKQYRIVIIERFLQGSWTDQIYYVPKTAMLNSLYRRIVGTSKESFFFYTPKKTQIMSTKTFEQIMQTYPTDDNIIYLQLVSMDSFGGEY